MGGYDDEICEACEGCGKTIRPGDLAHQGCDVWLCEECAPTWRDMKDQPGSFAGEDGDEMTREEADQKVGAHLRAGGQLDDKIVITFEEV